MAGINHLLQSLRDLCRSESLIESLLFSKEDIAIDLDKFKDGRADKLLIVGLSGSGKSTLGKKLAKTLDAGYKDLDDCWNRDIPDEEFSYEEHYLPCVSKALKDPGRRIVESVNIIDLAIENPEFDFLYDLPCILLGSSVTKSAFRAWIRGWKTYRRHVLPLHHLTMNYDIDKAYSEFEHRRLERGGSITVVYVAID